MFLGYHGKKVEWLITRTICQTPFTTQQFPPLDNTILHPHFLPETPASTCSHQLRDKAFQINTTPYIQTLFSPTPKRSRNRGTFLDKATRETQNKQLDQLNLSHRIQHSSGLLFQLRNLIKATESHSNNNLKRYLVLEMRPLLFDLGL